MKNMELQIKQLKEKIIVICGNIIKDDKIKIQIKDKMKDIENEIIVKLMRKRIVEIMILYWMKSEEMVIIK